MQDYIKSVVTDSPENMEEIASTPAENHLFTFNEETLDSST